MEGWEYRIPHRRHAENIRSATKAFTSAPKMMANRNVERQKELLDRLEGTVPHTLAASVTHEETLQNALNVYRKLLAARPKGESDGQGQGEG